MYIVKLTQNVNQIKVTNFVFLPELYYIIVQYSLIQKPSGHRIKG